MLALVITTRTGTATRSEQAFYADAEFDAQADLAENGTLRARLRRSDGRGFVLLLDAISQEAALEIVHRLPSVAMGISAYRLVAVEFVDAAAAGCRDTAVV